MEKKIFSRVKSGSRKSQAAKENVAIDIEPEDEERFEPAAAAPESSLPQATKSLHLLDAHIIFEPLLSSLGLMPQQIQNLSLKNLGSNVSVLANIAEFRCEPTKKINIYIILCMASPKY